MKQPHSTYLCGYARSSRMVSRPFLRASAIYSRIFSTKVSSLPIDWNSHDEFFRFTRGRFIVDEEQNLRKRGIKFDMNKLANVAADSVGAARCIDIKKFTDGMFNKAFLMYMDDGREVVAKVPNPNAGLVHYTTASEVATMDFAKRVLDIPVPHVYTWNSDSQSHPVGAEFIIMDKAEGVPLSHVWNTMILPQKLQVLLSLIKIHRQFLNVSFSHYGGLYYAKDLRSSHESHYIQDGEVIKDSEFAIGPATGRDWHDADRSSLDIERGPWSSLSQYLRSIGTREIKATQVLEPPKQIALFCGPKLYRPNSKEKLTALGQYLDIVDALIPRNTTISSPYLWHNDMHDDNIFVDPSNPGKITAIIDWQSCHISPLFNHNADPAFLDWDGLEPENLELTSKPDLSGLSTEERSAAVREYAHVNVFIAWRKLMQAKNPDLYQVIEFRKTAPNGLLFLAHRMFEYGEAHFQTLLVDLRDDWANLPAVAGEIPFPFEFSDADIERIQSNGDGAVAGTEVVTQVKESMGNLWPDKGFVEHELYNDCKAALQEVKEQIIVQLAESEEERKEYERYWPFD